MIFEALWGSAQKGELILVDHGMLHFHHRRDGQVTIREIIVIPDWQRQGVGKRMLGMLKYICSDATSIFAKVPIELQANAWYKHMGFEHEGFEETRTGRKLAKWRLRL